MCSLSHDSQTFVWQSANKSWTKRANIWLFQGCRPWCPPPLLPWPPSAASTPRSQPRRSDHKNLLHYFCPQLPLGYIWLHLPPSVTWLHLCHLSAGRWHLWDSHLASPEDSTVNCVTFWLNHHCQLFLCVKSGFSSLLMWESTKFCRQIILFIIFFCNRHKIAQNLSNWSSCGNQFFSGRNVLCSE